MNLHKLILTENDCYKAGKTITVKGIMVHSTGANNPNLKRYVGPDDGLLGQNKYNNHWNTATPGGRQVCVHAFIGKLADGTIATYQALPWNHRGWHGGGSSNNTHIGFEICEDDLTDATYFAKVYKEAVELCAYLCKEYGLTEKNIICHCEGYKHGIASNHGDVMHWFPKHGKSMDTFRADVKALLYSDEKEEESSAQTYPKKLTSGYYRVRKTWADKKSQVGAYRVLTNAKAVCDAHPGFSVYDNSGNEVYTAKASEITTETTTDVPFRVRVSITDLNIRRGAGTNYARTGHVTGAGVFTIVEVKSGQGSTAGWGRLKSGAGWISLDYAKRI